jgi:fructose 1,6-bisphosphatase
VGWLRFVPFSDTTNTAEILFSPLMAFTASAFLLRWLRGSGFKWLMPVAIAANLARFFQPPEFGISQANDLFTALALH